MLLNTNRLIPDELLSSLPEELQAWNSYVREIIEQQNQNPDWNNYNAK